MSEIGRRQPTLPCYINAGTSGTDENPTIIEQGTAYQAADHRYVSTQWQNYNIIMYVFSANKGLH